MKTYFICTIYIYDRHLETIKRDSLEEIKEELEKRFSPQLHIGNGIIEVIDDPDYSFKIVKVQEECLFN